MSFQNIPAELQQLKQWIVWKYEETSSDKPTKLPYNVNTGKLASVNVASHWTTFDEACSKAAESYSGIGLVLTESDPYTILDLDFSLDETIINRQIKVFNEFNSYSELSPSGKGLHIVVKGMVKSGRRRSNIEVYSSGRYITFTGNVYKNSPIYDRQGLLDILWAQIGDSVSVNKFTGHYDEKDTDENIIERASKALNGEKFKALNEGLWSNYYPSQSEADFAYVDMVAFYTQNRNQIARIFRNSKLGKRDKANRSDYIQFMLNRAFDRILPTVDIEGLSNALELAKVRAAALEPVRATEQGENPYTPPPGLMGELASYIYASAPRPVPEVALAAAIALMAGIAGRAYNVNGLGMNMYVLLLAPTGTGKEAMASGIDSLMASVKTQIPASKQFIGPAEIASGQALLKYLSKAPPCFVSLIGEFGLKLQQLSSNNANPAEIMLKRVLLDLFNKSGNGKILQPSIYSQKENNTDPINSPAVTLLGESTPETFFRAIDESMISDGLLPRFLIVEYAGLRPPLSENYQEARPSFALIDKFGGLIDKCLKIMNAIDSGTGLVLNVKFTPEAEAIHKKFDKYADNEINSSSAEIIKQLWNRAHVKLLKLSALVAVGCDQFEPTVTTEIVLWAKRIIEADIMKVLGRFESGKVGEPVGDSSQQTYIKRVIKEFIINPYEKVAPYDVPRKLWEDKLVSYGYISRRSISAPTFKGDRMGATFAIKKTITDLIDLGMLREIPKSELADKYKTTQRAFAVSSEGIVMS